MLECRHPEDVVGVVMITQIDFGYSDCSTGKVFYFRNNSAEQRHRIISTGVFSFQRKYGNSVLSHLPAMGSSCVSILLFLVPERADFKTL